MTTKPDPSTDITVPAMQAQGQPLAPKEQQFPKRPQTITNLELMDGIHSMERNIGGQLGDLKRGLRDLGNQVDDIVADQKKDRVRLAKVEAAQAGAIRPRAPSLHGINEDDLTESSVMSSDERFARLERDSIRKRKAQTSQTVTLVGALAAAVVAIVGSLTQLIGARAEHGAKEGAAEAVKEAPPRVVPVAVPVVPGATP